MSNWKPIREESDLPPTGKIVLVTTKEEGACLGVLLNTSWGLAWQLATPCKSVQWLYPDHGRAPIAWQPAPEAYDPEKKRAVVKMYDIDGEVLLVCQCGWNMWRHMAIVANDEITECDNCGRKHRLVVDVVTEEADGG